MVKSTFFPTSFSKRIVAVFSAMLRMLHGKETTVTLVAVTMNGAFESAEMWAHQSTYAGREGNRNLNIPDDPGLSEKEAFPVYEVFDRVFSETFPALKGLSRTESAQYVQLIMRKVARGLVEVGQSPRETEEYAALIKFSEGIAVALEAQAVTLNQN